MIRNNVSKKQTKTESRKGKLTVKINQNFRFLNYFSKKTKQKQTNKPKTKTNKPTKKFFDAAAKVHAGGDEKLIIVFTWLSLLGL